MASFFEKLTGASSEDKIKIPDIKKDKPAATRRDVPTSGGKQAGKKIKKEKLKMPKAKKTMKKPIEQIEPETELEPIEENKDWLEEVEGEEGQLTIDVFQTPSEIVIKSTVAGVDPDNVDISITNDMVTIRGKRSKDEKVEAENYYYQELYWGTFSRSIILPVEVDADRAKAGIKNGILTIKLPKIEKVRTKKIKVKLSE